MLRAKAVKTYRSARTTKPERRAGMTIFSSRSAKSVAYSRLNVSWFSECPALAAMIVSDISSERVQPVSMTPYPCTSSHCLSRVIWVVRPTPSVPSMVMRAPLRSSMRAYGRPWPKNVLRGLMRPPPPRGGSSGLPGRLVVQLGHQVAHVALLRVDAARAVDDAEVVLLRQAVVLLEDAPLE